MEIIKLTFIMAFLAYATLQILCPILINQQLSEDTFILESGKFMTKTVINVNTTIHSIDHIIDRIVNSLKMDTKYVNSTRFKSYVSFNSIPNNNRLESVRFSPLIYYDEIDTYENYMKLERNNSNFTLHDIDIPYFRQTGKFKIIPIKNQSEYLPVTLSEPNFIPEVIIGRDFYHLNIFELYYKNVFNTSNILISQKQTLFSQALSKRVTGNYISKGIPNFGEVTCAVVTFDLVKNSTNDLDFNEHVTFKVESDFYNETLFDNLKNIKKQFSKDIDLYQDKWTITFEFDDIYKAKVNEFNQIIYIIINIIIFIVFLLALVTIIFIYFRKYKDKHFLTERILGYVNHEIRNPLNGINGLVTLLITKLKTIVTENDYNLLFNDLTTIKSLCDLITHLVTDILDVERAVNGQISINTSEVNLCSLFNDIDKTLIQTKSEKPHIKFKMENNVKLNVVIDKYRVQQILLNLLSNAFKFTDKGSITLKVDRCNGGIKFSVIDTGCGIEPEKRKFIFKKFYQTKHDDYTRHGGMGLGLFLCKMLVELMNGEINFDSHLNGGTTFWFKFKCDVLEEVEV